MANQVKNVLIPPHRKLSEDEVLKVLELNNLDEVFKLPKIKLKDSALSELDVIIGDVIEIERTSFAGKSKYYRVVVD